MAMTDLVSGAFLFARQLHEHAGKVYEGVMLVEPLVDALLAQDYEKVRTLHEQISRMCGEAEQIKFALYEQAKDVHFASRGSYAFSRYVNSQQNVVGAVRDFADLLLSRETMIPAELRAAFRACVAHVVSISGQMISLAREFSSPAEADSPGSQGQDPLPALARVMGGNRRIRQLEMEFGQRVQHQENLTPPTTLALDRYSMALRKIADAAECAVDHLCLLVPKCGVEHNPRCG